MAKPLVDGLERDLGAEVRLIRLSAGGEAGRFFMQRHAVYVVPTFVLFDGQGEERLRMQGRVPDLAVVQAALR